MRPNENEIKETTEHRSPAIYAAFDDPHRAESAAGALLDHGIKADRISLVMNEEAKDKRGTPYDPELQYTQPTLVSGTAGATGRFDPLGNDIRQGTAVPLQGANNFPIGEDAEVDGGLNPAQNDYPRTGSNSPTELSSRPPNARYDFNPDLDKKEYNADYEANVDRENRNEAARDRQRARVDEVAAEGDEGLEVNRPDHARSQHDTDRTIGPAAYEPERAAKMGVTTTTIGDAASAAKTGLIAGLGIGALATAAALAVPGVGLVIGGGALATALAGLAASAGAGAIAGGVVGYLKDQGVPAHDIPRYQRAYEGGGAILSVQLEAEGEREAIEAILRKYGAMSVDRYGYAA
ncbi:MAG: hypothetical protein ACO1SV_17130 [Fimbriimonas sp.]